MHKTNIVKRVSIIILNYNSFDDTIRLMNEIISVSVNCCEYNIIIVDNSESGEQIKKLKDGISKKILSNIQVHLLICEKNYGYSHGNNRGLEFAEKLGSDFFLIINPDVTFCGKNVLLQLCNAVQDNELKEVVFYGPNVYNPYYKLYQSPIREMYQRIGRRDINKSARKLDDVYSIVGCCLFGNLQLFKSMGYFDENMFLYNEELVIGHLARLMNLRIRYISDITVFHLHSNKFNGIRNEIKKRKELMKSTMYFLNRYKKANIFELVFCFLGVAIVESVKIVIKYLIQKKNVA